MAARLAAAIALGLTLGGCSGGTELLNTASTTKTATVHHTTTTTTTRATTTTGPSPAARAYLTQLSSVQAKLLAAERRLGHPSTPKALSRAISRLAKAAGRLASDLAAIQPPAVVATMHARLIAIARTYSSRLTLAARAARSPRREVKAGRAVISATVKASTSFSSTVTAINSTLNGTSF